MRTVVFILLAALPGLALADMSPELQHKLESLAKESDSLARQRYQWEHVQAALLKQKQEIEAAQQGILAQQDTLAQRSAAHNQQVQAQTEALKHSKQGCNNGDDNSSGHANECNRDIKGLNQKSGDLNADAATLQAQQADLEARYAKASQDASDWNAHESQAVDRLNGVYRSMNDWLDRAYDMITNGDFRDEVAARSADAYCENHGLPAGTLPIPTMTRLADGYRKCLKYVLQAQKQTAVAPPPDS